jgi:UDP-N-acetylmuramoyl-L-alanyl-D-glutamate--2,6-diaminopimelate ligase
LAVGFSLGLDRAKLLEGVAALEAVPGRMELIDEGQDFQVLVDFAYTPDALLNALTTLKQIAQGRVHIVFGATGDRDQSKRPLMGEVVARNADQIYLTDDETYTEDPAAIRDAVYEGIMKGGGEKKTRIFDDRLDAIKASFKAAKKGDIVLLAGIGHEDYRNMGGKKLPWDERQIARKLL